MLGKYYVWGGVKAHILGFVSDGNCGISCSIWAVVAIIDGAYKGSVRQIALDNIKYVEEWKN